jgi:hypothetical protein
MKADPRILALCNGVTAKRPRAVIDGILRNGFITTEELQNLGYDHPPRAARDVRELGIPLETFSVVSERTGRKIAAYRFGDPAKIRRGRLDGRRAFPKAFKTELVTAYGARDTITGEAMDPAYLQIDHRIPYEVAGDDSGASMNVRDFMLLDAVTQRMKSWRCEHCLNWSDARNPGVCGTCYWASPEEYTHVAMEEIRRTDLEWRGEDVKLHDELALLAKRDGISVAEAIKRRLRHGRG